MDESLHYELDKKLCCGICLNVPSYEVVEMICPGHHTFCFSCIFQYISHLDDFQEAKCPTCRQGEGGIIESPFLSTLIKLRQEPKEDDEQLLKKFKEVTPLMRGVYPTVFEPNRYIITPMQLKIFERYQINPQSYQIQRIRTPVIRGQRSTTSSDRGYAAVNINWLDNQFVVSSHFLQMHARRATNLAPSHYNASFVVDLSSEERNVVFQARPVQIFLTMPFRSYVSNTFPSSPTIIETNTIIEHNTFSSSSITMESSTFSPLPIIIEIGEEIERLRQTIS